MPPEGTYRPRPVWVLGARALVPVGGTLEQVLAELSGRQRGRVSRRQLLAADVPARTAAHLVERGRLYPIHRGVYGVTPRIEVPWGRETAALLAFRPGAALAAAHALALWDMIALPDPAEPVHVIVGGHHTGRRDGIRAHQSRTLTAEDLTIRYRLPVTQPARALLDFADDCTRKELEAALDEGLALKRLTRGAIAELILRAGRGRAGAAALQSLLDERRPSGVTRSHGERRLKEMILSSGIRRPHTNHRLHGFVADFYWPEAAYVAEFDGYQFHHTRTAFRRDRAKDRTYAARGIRLDRFTWEDVTTHALQTIAHIATTIAERTTRGRATA